MRKNHSKIVCIKLVHLPYLPLKVSLENNHGLFSQRKKEKNTMSKQNTLVWKLKINWCK